MTAIYQILLVEQDQGPRTAVLHNAPFASRNPHAAKTFADAFNDRELADPLGIWAVVRVEESEPDLVLNARCSADFKM